MRPHGDAQTLERRRHQAIQLLKAGKSFREAADQMGASLSSVVRWHQAYRKKGKGGLKSKPTPGRPGLLTHQQKQRLIQTLLKGPLEAGYPTDLWTLKRIGQVVRQKFGVRYCIAGLWQVMNGLGWSRQKPEKRARERNEEAIRYWKSRVWPHIKKRRSAWSPLGVPR